ncbi:uncharacterized protein F5891DRAFT_1185724 [Suillus fuscotomentosus]|uniref:F-box domain-containing protein n=1 Tax=Suillus fuscotomentosus TaxID=1912939 RepID=A0AAD4EBH6_9AGAM|nr:uncharacterized protein F5891DRAFT_1185724 [Suillus fuscotomentosus]KAG1903082.1 hypothetical protein F5891DRAFT_1185724 [Suillus fuscotomentosus]
MTSKSKVGFLSLAEELHFDILSFLPYRDILRCTSVCKALRQTFISSSELQYIVELAGQGLLPVLNTEFHKHVPISRRLQLLKDNASAWFQFNFRLVSIRDHPAITPAYLQPQSSEVKRFFVDDHLYLFDETEQLVKIFPLVPQSSPQIHREWTPESLLPVSDAVIDHVWIDPAQNLIAIAYRTDDDDYLDSLSWPDRPFYIDLKALDGDGVHPQAAGQTLFLSELDDCQDSSFKLQGLGRHIAIQCGFCGMWWLQIWDWQHSTTSNSIISYTSSDDSDEDFCFLGNDRFLTISNLNFNLFLIEDVSQKPTFLANFLLPISELIYIDYVGPTDDIAHGPQLQMEAHQTLWTSDPEHRILFFVMNLHSVAFAVSTKVFFDLDPFKETLEEIPWELWGPPNTRAFNPESSFGVVGNRVFQAARVVGATADDGSAATEYRLYMMDFSPLAVQRRQGQGRVVKEPSTIVVENESITTSLPYVEVLSDGKYSADAHDVVKIWVDHYELYVPRLASPSAMN